MDWIVTYRGKSGSQEQMSLEAESREAVFKELAQRGLTAIRVEQTNGKAKPRKTSPKGASKPSGVFKGAIAGLIVVIAAVGAWYFLMQKQETAQPESSPKKTAKIAEVSPSLAPPVAEEPHKPVDPKEDYDHDKLYRDGQGVLRYKNGDARAYDPTRPKTVVKLNADPAMRKSVFTNRAENEIERFLTIQPGQTLFGTRRYDQHFENEFKKSLETPILIDEDDSPYVKEVKQAMIAAKIEICDRMRNGETLAAILEETRSELTRLAQYKRDLQHEVMKATENPDFSEQDLEDYISAANKMLESQGIAPIKGGAILRRGIILRQKGLAK